MIFHSLMRLNLARFCKHLFDVTAKLVIKDVVDERVADAVQIVDVRKPMKPFNNFAIANGQHQSCQKTDQENYQNSNVKFQYFNVVLRSLL